MKRLVNPRRLAVLGGAGILLACVGVLLWWTWWVGQPPALRFLDQRTLVYHRRRGNRATHVCCLAGDFDALAARARAELLARGFREEDNGNRDCDCTFAKGDYCRTTVVIRDFAFESATRDSIVWVPRPGWVSVEVRVVRRPLWESLPLRWQFWYQRHVLKSKSIRWKPSLRPLPPKTPSQGGGRY
jgi:hypothetical protein